MAGRWLVLTVKGPDDARSELLAQGLIAAGASAVEELDDGLRTWWPEPRSVEGFVQDLRARLERAALGAPIDVSWNQCADEDWLETWRRGLDVRRVSERILISPSWLTPHAGDGEILITIDPKMAFGTGEHATTRGGLRLLERAVRPGARVLDMGTGSGILAIAAARLGAAHVDAVECDDLAIDNAIENVRANGVADRVQVRHHAVDAAFLAESGSFDVVCANILSSVLLPLLSGFRAALYPGGALVVSGILVSESAPFCTSAEQAGFVLDVVDEEEDWWSGLFRAE